MITDFFVAERSDAAAIAANPSAFRPALCVKRLDNTVLADLWAAISSSAETASLQGEDYLLFNGDGGPWVFELPDDLVNGLAELPDDRLDSVCSGWAAGEEMQYFGISPGDLRRPLGDLRLVAGEAQRANKRLLLMMSL